MTLRCTSWFTLPPCASLPPSSARESASRCSAATDPSGPGAPPGTSLQMRYLPHVRRCYGGFRRRCVHSSGCWWRLRVCVTFRDYSHVICTVVSTAGTRMSVRIRPDARSGTMSGGDSATKALIATTYLGHLSTTQCTSIVCDHPYAVAT